MAAPPWNCGRSSKALDERERLLSSTYKSLKATIGSQPRPGK